MATKIVSATTVRSGGVGKREQSLMKAEALLAAAGEALAQQRWEDVLESSYRAALWVADAWVQGTKVARRARKPRSAWEQLRLVGIEGKRAADRFSAMARYRSRVLSGMEVSVDEAKARELYEMARDFYFEVYGEEELPAAA